MGSLTIASSVVNLFLPETFNKDLPETVEQMQECQGYLYIINLFIHSLAFEELQPITLSEIYLECFFEIGIFISHNTK